jgi:hypothetical protein
MHGLRIGTDCETYVGYITVIDLLTLLRNHLTLSMSSSNRTDSKRSGTTPFSKSTSYTLVLIHSE